MIEVDSISVSLGGVEVLDGIDLQVAAGEFVGLVGPNGAGKTTLLRTINGAIEPDSGAVRVADDEMSGLSSRSGSRRVATVPQDTSVQFAFSVEDVVAMGRTPHRERLGGADDGRQHVEEALERTATASLRDRRISTLSGGERQRVFLARALAQDAPALILDEPTASLDINHATRTLSLVSDLVDEDRAVLAAIHDLEAAARYCDRIVLLADGGAVASGRPAAVLTSDALATTFDTRSVVTENPVTGSQTVTPLPGTTEQCHRVHVLGGGPVGARVVATLRTAGHDVTAGPYADGDSALAVTDQLDVPAETVPPFAGLDAPSLSATRDRIASADVTVLADLTLTASGKLLDLADVADRLAVVEERPLSERNHAGERGGRRYERLAERGVETTVDEVAETVATLARESARHVSPEEI